MSEIPSQWKGSLAVVKNDNNTGGNLTVSGTVTASDYVGITESYTIEITSENVSQTTFNIDHTLGAQNVHVTIYDSDGNWIIADVTCVSTTRVSIHFDEAQTIGSVFYVQVRR